MKPNLLLILSSILLCVGCIDVANADNILNPPREAGQKSVLGLTAAPIPIVRIGFIGLGRRGGEALRQFCKQENVEIKALADMEQYNIDAAQIHLKSKGLTVATEYIGHEDSWKKLCERDDIDLILIYTDWLNHTPMAVYAMEQGKHVAVEVPAAMTVAECWQLVNTAEKTQKHCMMLENCCYDLFELATLNMAQQGVFGEVKHVEGAYIHDLRLLTLRSRLRDGVVYDPTNKEKDYVKNFTRRLGFYDNWRSEQNAIHDGNLYPTHGLGPVCQVLNIHRGDKMKYLVSMSSPQYGFTDFAKREYGEDSPEAQREYKKGDMNTTLIKTEKGKTIMIQHDVASPRPYSRIHLVSGTKGFAQKYPTPSIALEPGAHRALKPVEMDSLLQEYEFRFVKELKEKATSVSRYNEMEYFMNYRLIYCLQNGLPLDQDVYDAAEWSCLVELTEKSVLNGSKPVEIPDFTRGDWDKIMGYKHAYRD